MTNPIDVTTRGGKGSALTTGEMDTNLTNLARVAIQSISNEDAGNVELSNEATTINLTDPLRPVVPEHLQAGVDAALAAGDFTMGTTGFWTVPGVGLIIQWGTVAIVAGGTPPVTSQHTVTWPIPFPNAFFVLFGGGNTGTPSVFGSGQSCTVDVVIDSLIGLTGANIILTENTTSATPEEYYWIALGN